MIDIHTHILPGLDDGPENSAEALALARAAVKAGTGTMVATPHILNGLDMNRSIQIAANYNRFRRLLEAELPELQLLLGTEIYFRPRLSKLAHLEAATIAGAGVYMLVEFSLGEIPGRFERELEELQSSGVTPIVAHPERNAVVLRHPAFISRMIDAGALIQLNAGSLTGSFGRPVQKLARNLLKRGWVQVIASDAHGADLRGPGLQTAVSAAADIIGVANARRLVTENPQIIIEARPWPDHEILEHTTGGNQ